MASTHFFLRGKPTPRWSTICKVEAGGKVAWSPASAGLGLGGAEKLLPYTWTTRRANRDFHSDRDGVFHLFKQAIDQPAPDLLVRAVIKSVMLARLSVDSSGKFLYALN